jgi:hypothetical protein
VKKIPKNHQNFFFSLHKFSFVLFCLSFLIFWTETSFATTIKIGEINPLSGRFAKNGIEIHQGIEVAVAEANAAGGIGGRQIQIISRDDQSRPDVAISRAEELCSWEKVAAITGGYVDSLVGQIAATEKKFKTKDISYCRPIFFSLNFRSLLFVSSSDLLHCSGGTEN